MPSGLALFHIVNILFGTFFSFHAQFWELEGLAQLVTDPPGGTSTTIQNQHF